MQNSSGADEAGERSGDNPANPPAAAGDDAVVQMEWQRLERQRIEEERVEAEEDAAERAPRPRLPWPALLVALAAGLIAALVINAVLLTVRPQAPPAADASGERSAR